MGFSSWRGTVGLIKPTMRPGSLEETIRLLPDGIGVIPMVQGVRAGTRDEFENALQGYFDNARRLADAGVDLIHHSGTPPFMLLGYKGEAKLIRRWERELGVPNFTANQNIVRAMRALGVRKIIGASYSRLQNDLTIKYLTEAGFEVVAMDPIEVPFEQAGALSPERVHAHVKKTFLDNPGGEAIYLQGNAWRVLSIVEILENDLGVPVIETCAALSWEIQKRLHVREPRDGIGKLMREMP